MLGIIFASLASLFGEISDSVGKVKVLNHEESRFTMAFLSLFWSTIFFILVSVFKNEGFVFQMSSLPTFSVRAFLEVVQTYVTILAITGADRSTFGFVRTITIPLILLVDIILGYKIGVLPLAGIFVIMLALFALFLSKGIKKDSLGFVVFSAVNAVATISLFKYDITHFNSVAAEQMFTNLIVLTFVTFFAFFKAQENPFRFLTHRIFFLQSFSMGIGSVIGGYAYGFGPASILTAASRASTIFWSLLSGKFYFHESKIVLKFIIFILLLTGLVLLAMN